MDDRRVSVRISDGFIKSFAAPFLERYGEDSLFVRALSDLWTSAAARMLIEKGMLSDSAPVALFADAEALGVIRALSRDEALNLPLYQEPLGYADPGTIERCFDSAFGPSCFANWLSAFEKRKFATCTEVSRRLV